MSFKNYLNVYEFETKLPGSGETVKFKPLTTGNIKKLLIYENNTDEMDIENALDDIITSSVVSEGFDIKELYLQDRFFLLVEIRKKTKGEKYRFEHTCPKCNSQSIQVINLDSLPIIFPDALEGKVEINEKISVILKHITRKEQIKAYKFVDKSMNRLQKIADMSLLTHAAGIKAIITPDGKNDETSIEDRKYLLENIPTSAYERVRDWFDDNIFGVDFVIKIECPCGNKIQTEIPLENFFF